MGFFFPIQSSIFTPVVLSPFSLALNNEKGIDRNKMSPILLWHMSQTQHVPKRAHKHLDFSRFCFPLISEAE